MAKRQGRSLKKASGGRKWPSHKKRKHELGRESVNTRIGEKKKREISVRGNGRKSKLLRINSVNVTDPKTGESIKAEIQSVLENPADPNLARRNIITKGAIIETDVGRAEIKSRPGQEEALNAILLEGGLVKKPEEKVKEEVDEEETPEDKTGEEKKSKSTEDEKSS